MQKYSVPSTSVPVFDLLRARDVIASFKPIGLWVIGANGRIDILAEKGPFILVDLAEKLKSPRWVVFAPTSRRKEIPFDAKFIESLVK